MRRRAGQQRRGKAFIVRKKSALHISFDWCEQRHRRGFGGSQKFTKKYVLTVIATEPSFRTLQLGIFSSAENPPHRAGALC